jgi:hypothetical protein
MSNVKRGDGKRKSTCFDKWRMRFMRARHANRELSAETTSVQLLTIFAILFGKMPPIGHTSGPRPKPKTPLKAVPKEHRVMTFEDAVRHLRSPTRVTKRVTEAAERLKIYAPAASEYIDHCLKTGAFSELSRCLASSNEQLTIRKLNTFAAAWQNQNDDDLGAVPGGTALQP